MTDFITGLALGLLVASFWIDCACEEATNDRCALGVPNSVEATQ